MNEWAKVVTQPLGLIGFVLFLVFGYLAKTKRLDERRWVSPVAFSFAAIALIGGFALAYVETSKSLDRTIQSISPPSPIQQTSQANQVKQNSTGAGSPNVQDIKGDVVITVDQSTGETKTTTKEPAENKTKHASQ